MVCKDDDVVCKIVKNMSKPVEWQDPPQGSIKIRIYM